MSIKIDFLGSDKMILMIHYKVMYSTLTLLMFIIHSSKCQKPLASLITSVNGKWQLGCKRDLTVI